MSLQPPVSFIICRVLRLLLLSGGIAVFIWAFLDRRFRSPDGELNGTMCLPIALGVAFAVLGLTIGGQLQKPAFWCALALVGQAVSLQMIDAGLHIRYQHYRTLPRLATETPLLLIYLIAQSVLVMAGMRAHWSNLRDWVSRRFKLWQLLGVLIIWLLPSAAVSREASVYLSELPFAAFVQVVNLANILLVVLAMPPAALDWVERLFEKLTGPPDEAAGGVDRMAVLGAVWVTTIAAILCIFSYQRHPHIPDEVVYLYHARYFAAGMLDMPLPPAPDAISVDLMNYEADRWFCPVPPGWPLMLALGQLFGVPWLVNPILAGLNITLAFLLIKELYDRRAARIAVLLLSISPWHILMAMNFMTHTFTLTCALAAALAMAWARKTGRMRWGLASGMAVGMVGLIRPLEGFVLAVLLGLWSIGLGGRRLKFAAIAAFIIGGITVSAAVLPYNKFLTGDPRVFPIMAYTDKYYGPKTNAMGFGPERGLGWELDPFPGHGLLDALVNSNLNAFSVNIELLGWSTGSLILIALLLFSGTMRMGDYLMLSVIGVIYFVHIFYWYSGGPDFGARYWYLMIVPCVALTVRGMEYLHNEIAPMSGLAELNGGRVPAAVLLLCFFTLISYFPWRAIDKYYHYLNMRPDIRYLAKEYRFGKSLVLIRGARHPDYASAAIYNPLDLHADVPIYAWDRDAKTRKQALTAYPDRQVWIIDGPSITHGGFKVVEGPLSAQKLIAEQTAQEILQPEVP
jgi:hypothetical protein